MFPGFVALFVFALQGLGGGAPEAARRFLSARQSDEPGIFRGSSLTSGTPDQKLSHRDDAAGLRQGCTPALAAQYGWVTRPLVRFQTVTFLPRSCILAEYFCFSEQQPL